MEIPKIHESEYRFCLIMWEYEPVTAVELVKLCQDHLGWKRTTTYTVIKRLGERGVLRNDQGMITALVTKEEVQSCEIDELVEKKFEGSLPAFIAAFTKRRDISKEELDEVQRMIDRIRGGVQHVGMDKQGSAKFVGFFLYLKFQYSSQLVNIGDSGYTIPFKEST